MTKLEELKLVLSLIDKEYFLVGGAALWAYRNNSFPAGSGNNSFGIGIYGYNEEYKEELIKKLKNAGLNVTENKNKHDHTCDGTTIEAINELRLLIFFFQKGEEDWFSQRFPYQKWVSIANEFHKLEEIEFQGLKVKVPSPIEGYLEWAYGNNWRQKGKKSCFPPAKTSMKQFICIGIYRSGTSLVTGTLNQLGIDVGRHENEADPKANPWGFWEDHDVIDLHLKLLVLLGRPNFFLCERDDYLKLIDDPVANKLVKDYIEMRNNKGSIWAVKDPRMITFYPLFEKHLEAPHIIFIERKKESVLESWKIMHPELAVPLHRHDGKDGMSQIDIIYEELLADYKNIKANNKHPSITVDYSEYIDNREATAKKIADFVGVPVNQGALEFCKKYSISGKK